MAKYTLDRATSKIRIFSFKHGLLSAVAHDLEIDAPTFDATFTLDDGTCSLNVTIPAADLAVCSTNVDAGQRRDIQKNIQKKVLNTRKHPTITVAHRGKFEVGPQACKADITVVGRTVRSAIDVAAASTDDAITLTTRVEIAQTSFGIKPFSAMMGTLKIKDVIRLEGELRFVSV